MLAANAAIEVVGLELLPLAGPRQRIRSDLATTFIRSQSNPATPSTRTADDFFPEQLWGKNLAIFFDEIFRKKARNSPSRGGFAMPSRGPD